MPIFSEVVPIFSASVADEDEDDGDPEGGEGEAQRSKVTAHRRLPGMERLTRQAHERPGFECEPWPDVALSRRASVPMAPPGNGAKA